jgi:ATP-independent RNA helicase DbpA
MENNFQHLDLDLRLKRNLTELKFFNMTPIQAKSLPLIIKGEDIIAKAKTGSGKTAAFGLGVLNSLEIKLMKPQSLVLCPTRELAEQVASEIRSLARAIANTKVITLTGGKSEYQQKKSLQYGAHIVIATPGRLLKLLKTGSLPVDRIRHFVLDEADRMLDMGFNEDIMKIASYISAKRQTLLFSATYPEQIKEMSSKLQENAHMVEVDTVHSNEVIIEEFFELDSHKDKIKALFEVLGKNRPNRFIVFCKTKQITDRVADQLNNENICVEAIHSDLDQRERTEVLAMFSNHSLSGMIATDVAARGIDIQGIDLIINFDIPHDPEVYTHRIGRTGRAGHQGQAVSFLVSQEREKLEQILKIQGKTFELQKFNILDETEPYNVLPKMRTLMILGGKKDKLRPGDIAGAIVGESGVDFNCIGDISISNAITYVAVEAQKSKQVFNALKSGRIKKKKFRVEMC